MIVTWPMLCSVPRAPMCGLRAPPARLDRRLERLPQQYPSSVPREGQADQGGWTSMLAGLARVTHWHCDQADGEKTGRRDHPPDSPWPARACGETASQLTWRQSPQHRFHRTVEWHLPRAIGQLDAQISSRRSLPQSPGDGHVSDWMLLQFLFSAP